MTASMPLNDARDLVERINYRPTWTRYELAAAAKALPAHVRRQLGEAIRVVGEAAQIEAAVFQAGLADDDGSGDDPIIAKIRGHADLIRYIVSNFDAYEIEAFSRAQLYAALSEISATSEAILRLTGVCDLNKHFEDVWCSLSMGRDPLLGSGADQPYRPHQDAA